MLRAIIERSIRGRLADIYEKLAIVSGGMAELSERLKQLIDHVADNRKTLNVLIEMHAQMISAVAEEEGRMARRDIPSLADLLTPPVDDDDMPN